MAKHPGGRPSTYTKELADEICCAIAEHNVGIESLCNMFPHWPHHRTIFKWLHQYEEFGHQYALAKKRQIDVFVNDINNLTNESHYYMDSEGNQRIDASILRTKVDARKWMASKLVPKVYGERISQDTTVTIKHEDALKELE